MRNKRRICENLIWLLFCLNLATFILCVTFAPRKSSFRWRTGDPLSYWVNSRRWDAVPGVMLASVIVSVGVYQFISEYPDESE